MKVYGFYVVKLLDLYMDEIFRKTLVNCQAYLVGNIECDYLIDFLLQHEVLPKATVEDINSFSTRTQKVRKLLDVLPRRTNLAFETFLRCLRMTHQAHIAERVEATLFRIRSQNRISLNENVFLPPLPVKAVHTSSQHELSQNRPLKSNFSPKHDFESNKTELPVSIACSEQADPYCLVPEQELSMELEKDCYEMNSKPCGYALIINNENFTAPLTRRNGSSKDASDLKQLFWRFGFYCDVKHNQEVTDMKRLLSDFSKMDEHKNLSCCAVVLMSHGDEDPEEHIYGTKGKKVPVNELINYFSDQNCPHMKDKPKLFIIQACRTNDSQRPPLMRLLSLDLSSDAVNYSTTNSRADMLIAYSTAHGNKSFRHKMTGSIFIQIIIDVFDRKAHSTSVTDMLIEVNRKLREEYPHQGQIGVPEVSLTKKWYLKPI